MAKGRSGITGFKADKSGYWPVQNSSGVQSILKRKAGYAAGTANAALGENAYSAKQIHGSHAKGYIVSVALGDGKHAFDDADRREDILKHLF